jgi:predicted phage baseplate assembly protein
MALPIPNLDDRKFQDIVDEAKRRIPRLCPEWTDHNVSDPGIAVVELFAWMTDMVLHRTNQVPDKLYTKFLEMLGVTLEPPRAATVPVTFYLSAAQESAVNVSDGVEVATLRTETSPAIIFSTEQPLEIRPPVTLGAYTRAAQQQRDAPWLQHDLARLQLPGQRLPLFPRTPSAGDAFYLAFETDLSQHVLALVMKCEIAGGAGIDPTKPPLVWEVFSGAATQWVTCEVEYDGTGGFNTDGEIILHLPKMQTRAFQNVNAYWLRVRLTDDQAGDLSYKVSPEIEGLKIESRGGTVSARHAVSVYNEYLGISDGTPGQRFKLLHAPILARDAERDHLQLEHSGEVERWTEVSDFANSHRDDQHYTLDNLEGMIQFGPTLPQPDGTVYSFGATPLKGSSLRFSRYQYGGGVTGNVPRGALSVLKTSLPYVARITNRVAAVGGRDAQNLEDAKNRAPQVLRTRTRAVAADDYEYLASQIKGVARAHCIAPGQFPPQPGDPRPGQVIVVVLPASETKFPARIPQEVMTLSAETRAEVLAHLEPRRLMGTALEVRGPTLVWVSIEAKIRVHERADPDMIAAVEHAASAALHQFINPYSGGLRGQGWVFGRDLHIPEILAVLQRVEGVEYVEDVKLGVSESGSNEPSRPVAGHLVVPRGALVCSDNHRVQVLTRAEG